MESFLHRWIQVDLFAATFAITDDLFWDNLRCFLDGGYQYKLIVINYGFHHGFAMQCKMNEKNASIFKRGYQKLIEMCQQLCDEIVIMTGTSFALEDNINMIDTELEQEVLARNTIVKQAAMDMGCNIFDLYHLMRTRGREYKYIDYVHFEQKAYSFIAYEIVTSLAVIDEKECETLQEEVVKALEKITKVTIYGTGFLANHLYFLLRYFCPDIKIMSWAVTDNSNNENEIHGIPVLSISEVDRDACLVIAASLKSKCEMKNIAEGLGFSKIKCFTDIRWENLLENA